MVTVEVRRTEYGLTIQLPEGLGYEDGTRFALVPSGIGLKLLYITEDISDQLGMAQKVEQRWRNVLEQLAR